MHTKRQMLNSALKSNNSLFKGLSKKGIKMTKLHFYSGSGPGTLSGVKACIFGATASIGYKIAGTLMNSGVPTVMCHRHPLDYLNPTGDDPLYSRSNPLGTWKEFMFAFDTHRAGLVETRINSELGMRYYQLVMDLTNEWDIENGIKDCDIVINLIGEKPVIKHDFNFEEPNVLIPRAIAKVCARMQNEQKVKRLFHFSAAGCNPDAISRRLRTKWQGEQEVKKYFPEATIIRPTTIISDNGTGNFIGYYMHCWHNNNGTVLLMDDGQCLRQPVLDDDIVLAIFNMLQLENSVGSTYELGGIHKYNMKELLEFFSNTMNHRPRFINYSFEDFMKLNLSPNMNFEKAVNWLIARPDYSSELRTDIVVNKRDEVKTFEDLHIIPVATHHVLNDLGQWMLERTNVESSAVRSHDEHDANDDANV